MTVELCHILAINTAYNLITYRKMYSDPISSLGLRFKMHGRCCDYGVYANELSALCKANSYDVVCIAETWLDSEISGSEVNISGYS